MKYLDASISMLFIYVVLVICVDKETANQLFEQILQSE